MSAVETRRLVRERAEGRCEYCRSPADHTPDDFAAEHIIPQSQGGSDELDNLAWSCQGCNSRKFTATQAVGPESNRRVTLYHPRRHSWDDHFRWSEDGLTVIGRATIARLGLNRDNVVNFRAILIPAGKHPPSG